MPVPLVSHREVCARIEQARTRNASDGGHCCYTYKRWILNEFTCIPYGTEHFSRYRQVTKSQRLQIEQSEKRQRINELLGKDSMSDDERGELESLTGRMQQIEVEYRAAVVAEGADLDQRRGEAGDMDPETRERVELRSKARLTEYLTCRAQGRLPSGAEAELQAAAGVSGIPLELWDVPAPERRSGAEQRAITPTPGTVGINLDPIRPAVFANSIRATARDRNAARHVGHLRDRHNHDVADCIGAREVRSGCRHCGRDHRHHGDPPQGLAPVLNWLWRTSPP